MEVVSGTALGLGGGQFCLRFQRAAWSASPDAQGILPFLLPADRIFTKGGDGFTAADVAAQGLACTTNPDGASGDCTLTFADATAPRLLQPNWGAFPPSGDIASWQVDVRVSGGVMLGGVAGRPGVAAVGCSRAS